MRWLVGWSSAAPKGTPADRPRAGGVGRAAGDALADPLADLLSTGTGARTGPADGARPRASRTTAHPGPTPHDSRFDGGSLHPVGAQLLWGDPDPLWAVGDWRPDEVRVITADGDHRMAVFGCCGATDTELRLGLTAARGGAFRHLTAWPGSYTAVACVGRRITVAADLAGYRPVFHAPWAGGTAYATAALPLADLTEAELDIGHLGALLACPDAPEALGDTTPYTGVRRVPPGHALIMREGGSREIAAYEQSASLVVSAPPPLDTDTAVAAVHDALVDAVRARLAGPRHATEGDLGHPHAHTPGPHGTDRAGRAAHAGANGHPHPAPGARPAPAAGNAVHPRTPGGAPTDARQHPRTDPTTGRDPGPVPGMGPADRRAARGAPAPGVGADLSGGPASATLALLAAGLPGRPGTLHGALDGTEAGQRLLAVTFNDLTTAPAASADAVPELERAHALAEDPRLHHVVVTGDDDTLPYATLDGPLTDEPGPSLVTADRHRRRLVSGSADHFVGLGARQVLDAHPARLADLLLDRRRRHLLRPVAALTRADDTPAGRSVAVPWTVYRAARRLARTPYRDGVLETARRLRDLAASGRDATGARRGPAAATAGPHDPLADPGTPARYSTESAVGASLAALTWCRPGPAARWLTGEALADVARRLEASARLHPTIERPGERRARAALARQAADHHVLEQAVEIRNQRLHAPFYDNQVVRACRALPEALRVRPDARAWVLRTVLAGAGVHDLPAGWGTPSHATHRAAARAGLRTAADHLVQLFDAPLLADAGLIDARVIRNALRSAAEGERQPLDGLADIVSTELWLRRLLARRGSCWTGTEARRQRAAAGGIVPVRQRPAL